MRAYITENKEIPVPQRKIYIAGPMTGLIDANRPAFHLHAFKVAQAGHVALNPAVLPDGLQHHEYMAICKPMVEIADEVHMLPGWEHSKGAMQEHQWATAMGKEVHFVGGKA